MFKDSISVLPTDTPRSCIPETNANSCDLDLGNVIPRHILEITKSFGNKGVLDLEGISL